MKIIIILLLLIHSTHSATAEVMNHISFGDATGHWRVKIRENGSATISSKNATATWADAPPGSFDLMKIEAKLGRLLDLDPGLEYPVYAYSSLRPELDSTKVHYPANLDYLKTLFRAVLAKSNFFTDTPQRFRAFLYETPPMGLDDLELENWQLETYARATAGPFHWEKRQRKSKWPEWSQRYPLLDKIHPVVSELFSTPWPYLAMLALLALVLRRYRLNRRNKLANS